MMVLYHGKVKRFMGLDDPVVCDYDSVVNRAKEKKEKVALLIPIFIG